MAKGKEPLLASGVYAALATPRRTEAVEPDAAALLDYLDAVTRAGIDGIVLFGSTGEFVHFDLADRMRVLALAIRRSRVPVLVNVSHSTLAGAIDLAENSIEAGAAGVLLMPPYFYRYTDAQLAEFYQFFAVAVRSRIHSYLYNLSSFTNPISPALASRLLQSESFVGIKDSGADPQLFETLRDLRTRLPFQWLAGNELVYLKCRHAGADGIVSGVAGAVPELVVALDRAILSDDRERAERLHARLQELVAWVERFPATTAIKQAAVARGWPLNHFPFPLDEDTQADLAAFHHWFHTWLPAVLNECGQAAAVKA